MQQAKDIILSDLSESDKKEILQNGRYKDYMELYNGDEDAVWEEFIADIFADMNKFSDSYIDTAVDYWYNDKVIDRYNPSEYIKSIDSGGNEAVLDNIGFGNEYSLNNHTPKIKLSKQEYALVSKAVMAKNAGKTDNELKPVDFVYAADEFYVYENHSIGEFSVINKYDVETEYERIDVLRELINNGIHSNTNGERLNRLIDDVRRGKGSHSRNNGGAEDGRYAMADDRISGEQQRSNSIGHSSGIGANNRVKYALNSYDTDSETLTPERKKAIFEQWEKDRAGIEKPTKRQLWGERAEWVAHNATRVFPNIPERGEKGTFFAEFRKDMIQWKNLPTTASFMVQDKLFSHLKDKQGTSTFKIPVKAFERYYDGVENVHNFREAILRYSAYLYFKDEINKNSGKVKDYVASNKYIVKGLNSTEDKAYQLSKEFARCV